MHGFINTSVRACFHLSWFCIKSVIAGSLQCHGNSKMLNVHCQLGWIYNDPGEWWVAPLSVLWRHFQGGLTEWEDSFCVWAALPHSLGNTDRIKGEGEQARRAPACPSLCFLAHHISALLSGVHPAMVELSLRPCKPTQTLPLFLPRSLSHQ